MIRRPPRSTRVRSSAASDVYKRQAQDYKKELLLAYQNEDRYFLLKRKISFEQYKQLRDFVLVKEGRNKSGFIIDVRDSRVNPYVLLANRTIGLSRGDTSK